MKKGVAVSLAPVPHPSGLTLPNFSFFAYQFPCYFFIYRCAQSGDLSPWEAMYSKGLSDQFTRMRNCQRITRTGLFYTLPNAKGRAKREVIYFNVCVALPISNSNRSLGQSKVALAFPTADPSFNGKVITDLMFKGPKLNSNHPY